MNYPLDTMLLILLWLQFLILVLHDTVPLGRWNNVHHFRTAVPLQRRVIGTLINGLTGALAIVLYYAGRPHAEEAHSSHYDRTGVIVVQALLFIGELRSWWWPWMFGASVETVGHLRPNWEGTVCVLPERNGLRINALHFVLHAVTLAALLLAVVEML